jgi:translation initiation factor IF-2
VQNNSKWKDYICRYVSFYITLIAGRLDTLKHFKDDVKEVRKGSECGLSFAEFEDLKVGDLVQSFKELEVKRKLY